MLRVVYRACFISVLLLIASAAAGVGSPPVDNAGPAVSLYRQLRDLGLDPARVYRIRDASMDRGEIHISLMSGTIAFSQSVDGRVTGAFFDGDGEILLVPPNQVERTSMALFTGAPILEERFSTAFFRFNDDTLERLTPALRPAEDAPEFLARWESTFRQLCVTDALELLRLLTWQGPPGEARDTFWHARLAGLHLGPFDVVYDPEKSEQVLVGQSNYVNGAQIFDIWASFTSRASDLSRAGAPAASNKLGRSSFRVATTRIRTHILPPHELEAEAQLTLEAAKDGPRCLVFELSRYLKVSSVLSGDAPLEFIQNESLEGGDLARRGNDLVAVVLPHPLRTREQLVLRFKYNGSVLSEAGSGLMYVGERGIWYPNLGPAMSNFDLEFRYPAGWRLVATGKRVSTEIVAGEQVSRWVSDRPIPLAGFNLGKYTTTSAKMKETMVEVFAARGVEKSFPQAGPVLLDPRPFPGRRRETIMIPTPPLHPAPSVGGQAVAQQTVHALNFFSRHLGPFPFNSLAVTQMPGPLSQGWPGLIFLSSYAFVSGEERERLHLGSYEKVLYGGLVQAHETAHQWWGDAVMWKGYRDVWLSEALANYYALLALEQEKPDSFRTVMEHYRVELARKWHEGPAMKDAGPVTMGRRLTSFRFPEAYEVVVYGRGTWLIHMLREMFRDVDRESADPDARFFHALRGLRERFDGRTFSTADFQKALEDALPTSLRYDGKKSLAWFFDGWVNGTALPSFQLASVKFARRSGKLVASGTLVQRDAPDTLVTSVPLYAETQGGKSVYLGRIFADGPETEFSLPVPAGTRGLVIDPDQTVPTRP
jgi:hypothetical protein